MIKAYTGEGMKWDFVKKSVMYIYPIPDYSAFSACSYVFFLGAANLIIFNRVFTKKTEDELASTRNYTPHCGR
ncbi:hypothetical protein GCM10020331_074940 [Ectobacillus funiculus]